jgi:hypothetical protein
MLQVTVVTVVAHDNVLVIRARDKVVVEGNSMQSNNQHEDKGASTPKEHLEERTRSNVSGSTVRVCT